MSTPRQRSSSASSPSEKRNGKAAASPSISPQIPAPLPAVDDREGWRAHWQAQGQPWRTEPEIDQKRQAELAQHRALAPDIEKGIYSFKGMKLSRADVEWLLATHENGRGPVDWYDESQEKREGLDLRGADLQGEDLSRLPLARIRGGLCFDEWEKATPEQREWASVRLEHCNLFWVHLEHAKMRKAHLEGVDLSWTHLKGADLREAHLEKANPLRAHLEEAHLIEAYLVGANLSEALLEKARLENIALSDGKQIGPQMVDAQLGGTNLAVVKWSQVEMLAEEDLARESMRGGKLKDRMTRVDEYERAIRANRQLAVALETQGLNEYAVRFAYRAQALQKNTLWFQMLMPKMKMRRRIQALGAWLFSWFLFLLAGCGYKPGRSFLAYLLVICSFATAYYFLGHTVGPALSPLGAFVFSMTSFHLSKVQC